MKNNQPVTGVNREYATSANILSTTDLKGIITYVNTDFVNISGFTADELNGYNHNVVRHPDMPPFRISGIRSKTVIPGWVS